MIIKKISFFSFIFLCFSCATVVPPSGGEKDSTPPMLLKSFPESKKTNFDDDKIVFVFDELISLNNFRENFIISPALGNSVKTKIKKNKLYIFLGNDSLKQNTTYNISLNNCIADFTEGNILKDLNYVFSTGSFIDSFSLICTGVNSLKNSFITDFTGILINKINKTKYYSTSGADGEISFYNISNGKYDFYCFKDINKNKTADTKELYYSNEVEIGSSTINNFKRIYFSPKIPSDTVKLKAQKCTYINKNCISINFNRFIKENDIINYSINNSEFKKTPKLIATAEKDSFLIFFNSSKNLTSTLKIETNGLIDSFKIKNPKIIKDENLTLTMFSSIVVIDQEIFFESSLPINLINSKKILINGSPIENDAELINNYKIKLKNYTSFPAQIIFNKGSLTDFDGNSDFTDTFSVKLATNEETGNVSFVVFDTTMLCKGQLLINVYNKNFNNKVITTPEKSVKISSLIPGNYDLEIILDNNLNGIAEENERIIKLENFFIIKANWDIENVNIYIN